MSLLTIKITFSRLISGKVARFSSVGKKKFKTESSLSPEEQRILDFKNLLLDLKGTQGSVLSLRSQMFKNKSFRKKHGLSFSSVKFIFDEVGVNTKKPRIKIKLNLLKKINILAKDICDEYTLPVKLREIIKFYINLNNYKGSRHSKYLPVRGQRTHTNAKTRKKSKRGSVLKKWSKKVKRVIKKKQK